MIKKNILENSEIFELKNKCKLVQRSIARVVENIQEVRVVEIPVGNIKDISLKRDGKQDNKEQKENEQTRNMQN